MASPKHNTVGIAEMAVSDVAGDTLVTYALGSCLGISVYDPAARVGGLVHCMLPLSKMDREGGTATPCKFVDTGVAALFRRAYELGAKKERMILKVAGGAKIIDRADQFKIGERNYAALRKILWKNGILIDSEDVGGGQSRTMWVQVDTGTVTIKSNGALTEL